jgi:hypothetical protein
MMNPPGGQSVEISHIQRSSICFLPCTLGRVPASERNYEKI